MGRNLSHKSRYRLGFAMGLLFIFLFSNGSYVEGMQPYFAFDELVKKADAIFVGEVVNIESRHGPNQKMILTDVSFNVEQLIYTKDQAVQSMKQIISLTFAGGELNGKSVKVSDVPSFEIGGRYILFTRMDEKTYASPVIGGTQGFFRLIIDETNGVVYPLTYGRNAIVGLQNNNIIPGPSVERIKGGVIEGKSNNVPDRFHAVPPKAVEKQGAVPGAQAKVSAKVSSLRSQAVTPMNLEQFLAGIYQRLGR